MRMVPADVLPVYLTKICLPLAIVIPCDRIYRERLWKVRTALESGAFGTESVTHIEGYLYFSCTW